METEKNPRAQVAEFILALNAASSELDRLEQRAAARRNWAPPLSDDNRIATIVAIGLEKARTDGSFQN
jgi:hypothetical protein